MVSVQASFALYDGMTQPLRSIHRALEIVLNSFQAMQTASSRSIDMHAIQEAREELARAGASLNQVQANVNRAGLEQQSFNQHIRDGTTAADSLLSRFKGILATVLSIAGIKMAINWVVDNLKLSDIQRNAERQLQVVLNNIAAEEASVPISVDLQVSDAQINSAFDRITDKAAEIQGRGMFGDEVMIAGAAELSTYFSDENAVRGMMDTLADYAAGMSQGREVDYKQMTDYATNLGKLTNGSYIAMTQKGFAISDAQKAIIEGTATQAQIVETLGAEYLDMSRDMQAAAAISQVISERWAGMYEAMSNTPSGKIIQMKNAFGDVREEIGDRLYPAVLQFVDTFNSRLPQVASTLGGFAGICSALIVVLTAIFSLAVRVGSAIADNWDMIGPVVLGAAAALGVYLWITKGVEAAHTFGKAVTAAYHATINFLSIGYGILTGNTAAASAATYTFNSALMASPITWAVIGVIALAAAFYAAVGAINHFAGTSISATGLIIGAFAVLVAFIANTVIIPVTNGLWMLAYFLGNVFNNPVAAVKMLFLDMASSVIGYIVNMADAIENIINKIPGVQVDITSGLDGVYDYIKDAQQRVKDESGWVEYAKRIDYIDYGNAAGAGYDFGKGLADKISGIFKLPGLEDSFNFDLEDKINGIYDNAANTAANTAATADALDYAKEDLQLMRDIAEREAINRYTTAEIKVEQHNTNYIDKGGDLDGIMDAWAEDFAERLDISAEGVEE